MHDHPEVRDDEMRRAAAQLRAAHACAAEACPNRAVLVGRVAQPDTLAIIDLPLCAVHAHALADEHDGQETPLGPVVRLVPAAAR